MAHLDRWIVGILVGAIGIGGLFLAARAADGMMYAVGLMLFVGAVLFNFLQIKQTVGRKG